jgi:Tol biopolymer transport system component
MMILIRRLIVMTTCLIPLSALVMFGAIAAGRLVIITAQIAYIKQVRAETGVYLIDIDRKMQVNMLPLDDRHSAGVIRKTVVYSPRNPLAWSPDGQRLAYLSTANEFSLNVVNLSRQIQVLTTTPHLLEGLDWSPDGSSVTYVDRKDAAAGDLFTVSVRADELTQVEPQVFYQTASDEQQPVWSPDGTHVAFMSGTILYLLTLEQPDMKPLPLTEANLLPIAYAWSPDSSRIALAGNHLTNSVNGVIYTDLYLIDLATGHTTALGIRNPSGTLYDVSWSPDGKKVAFVSNHVITQQALFVWDLDELYPNMLTDQRLDNVTSPNWSPDSSKLIFSAFNRRRATVDLYMVDSDGANLHRIPQVSGYIWSPRWRPRPYPRLGQ